MTGRRPGSTELQTQKLNPVGEKLHTVSTYPAIVAHCSLTLHGFLSFLPCPIGIYVLTTLDFSFLICKMDTLLLYLSHKVIAISNLKT
jgi:hypothetical protein